MKATAKNEIARDKTHIQPQCFERPSFLFHYILVTSPCHIMISTAIHYDQFRLSICSHLGFNSVKFKSCKLEASFDMDKRLPSRQIERLKEHS